MQNQTEFLKNERIESFKEDRTIVSRSMKSHRLISLMLFIVMMFTFTLAPQDASACKYDRMVAKYMKYVAQYLAAPAGSQAELTALIKLCQQRRAIIIKRFRDKPVPPLPPGVVCPAAGPGAGGGGGINGGGRGGGVGGFGGPGGGPFGANLWMRNLRDESCTLEWEITLDLANPLDLTVSALIGTITAGAFSSTLLETVPLEFEWASTTVVGTEALVNITITDGCTGLPYPDEYGPMVLKAVSDIKVEPLAPVVAVANGSPFTVTWRITNLSTDTVTKSYTFKAVPDAQSNSELNNGFVYSILNAVSADKSVGGGSVTIPPGESEDISWDLKPTEYCDPEMLGCCGIEIDGALSCILTPNDQLGDQSTDCGEENLLVGSPLGGTVSVLINHNAQSFIVQERTDPGDQLNDIIDGLALQMIQRFETENDFNFQPLVFENGISMMTPPGTSVNFFSNDPGLNWGQEPCLFPVDLLVFEGAFEINIFDLGIIDFQDVGTVVVRREEPFPTPGGEAIPIELVALTLTSSSPITVTGAGHQGGTGSTSGTGTQTGSSTSIQGLRLDAGSLYGLPPSEGIIIIPDPILVPFSLSSFDLGFRLKYNPTLTLNEALRFEAIVDAYPPYGETFFAVIDHLPAPLFDSSTGDLVGEITQASITFQAPPCELVVDLKDCETIFPAYEPRSCIELFPIVSQGEAPFDYLWSTGETTIIIEACRPMKETPYTLTVTDANGCQATDEIHVNVVDVSCGKNNNKVQLCHRNLAKQGTICISSNSVSSHLENHDDVLGPCDLLDPCDARKTCQKVVEAETGAITSFEIYPNPNNGLLTIEMYIAETQDVQIRLYQFNGQLIYSSVSNNVEGHLIRSLDLKDYNKGIYYLQVISNEGSYTRKVVYQ
ncbi:MAG: T9SS type A sorting domain-containing protein [Bacteroidetes bacterium]|nr:T9SS type A sorting domain-containing protein [Bacteroidota bacterium]